MVKKNSYSIRHYLSGFSSILSSPFYYMFVFGNTIYIYDVREFGIWYVTIFRSSVLNSIERRFDEVYPGCISFKYKVGSFNPVN